MLAPGRITLLRAQAGPLAGDHDRVEIVVESGTLTVEPVAATVALPGPERTLLELDVTVGAGAHVHLEDAPLVVTEGADVTRRTTIRLHPGATATVLDVVILGRAGEGPGRLDSLLRCDGILHDALRVEPETWAEDAHVVLAPGHRALLTLARSGCPATCTGPATSSGDPHPPPRKWRQHVRRGGLATEKGCERSARLPRDLRGPPRRHLRVLRAAGAAG